MSDMGRRRRYNEDAVACFEPVGTELAASGRLYVVADGAGGRTVGQAASRYAVRSVLYEYYQSDEPDLIQRLAGAISIANLDIFEHARQRLGLVRMGATLVAAVVRGDQLLVANVGNSRAYLARVGRIEPLTRDHSAAARLVDEGAISEERARQYPERHQILRRLGMDGEVSVDVFSRRLTVGHMVVLCTDGLTRHLSDEDIADIATTREPQAAAQQLIQLANKRGGQDNISVTVIGVKETASRPLPQGAPAGPRPEAPQWQAIYDELAAERPARHLRVSPRNLHRGIVLTLGLILLACVLLLWRFRVSGPEGFSFLSPGAPSGATPQETVSAIASLAPTSTAGPISSTATLTLPPATEELPTPPRPISMATLTVASRPEPTITITPTEKPGPTITPTQKPSPTTTPRKAPTTAALKTTATPTEALATDTPTSTAIPSPAAATETLTLTPVTATVVSPAEEESPAATPVAETTDTPTLTPSPTKTLTPTAEATIELSPAVTVTSAPTLSPTVYITVAIPSTATPGVVSNPKYGGANVRTGPGLEYEVLTFLEDGTPVGIIGYDKGWDNIFWPDRADGAWILGRLVSVTQETIPAPQPTSGEQ